MSQQALWLWMWLWLWLREFDIAVAQCPRRLLETQGWRLGTGQVDSGGGGGVSGGMRCRKRV